MSNTVTGKRVFAIATDPIYVGTGGYTIGRVDNTIVRDPITRIPKIPGSSVAGTWRYYMALKLQAAFKEEYRKDLEKRDEQKQLEDLFESPKEWMKGYAGNRWAKLKCAGQDDAPEDSEGKTGHCGQCIVCKAFGYSKRDRSWQGMLFFSDLNILFFPVYTRFGTKWVTSERILKDAGLIQEKQEGPGEKVVFVQEEIEKDRSEGEINLGWLNLPYEVKPLNIFLDELRDWIKLEDIVVVPDSLISHIINSNLEVRTSVSIDPITGAAKEGALFTSEAIPRGAVFYGRIRLFDRSQFSKEELPEKQLIWKALEDSKAFYETLGIGGMTTRGFGRMRIKLGEVNDSRPTENQNGGDQNDSEES